MKPCLIGMEACATAHHWARELMTLGHEVRLIPPRYVKPDVKRNKNDAVDAEAICMARNGLMHGRLWPETVALSALGQLTTGFVQRIWCRDAAAVSAHSRSGYSGSL